MSRRKCNRSQNSFKKKQLNVWEQEKENITLFFSSLLFLMIKGTHIPYRRFGKFLKKKIQNEKYFPEFHHLERNTLTFWILSFQDHFWKTNFPMDELYSRHIIWWMKWKLLLAHLFIHASTSFTRCAATGHSFIYSQGTRPVSVVATKVNKIWTL